MTRERAKELLPVIQAYAEGKTIQFLDPFSKTWHDCTEAGFADDSTFRVKPESRQWWLVFMEDGKVDVCAVTPGECTHIGHFKELIHVREVL